MCGIYCSISSAANNEPSNRLVRLLKSRGPDSCSAHRVVFRKHRSDLPLYLYFHSTVLSLRGPAVVAQPLVDEKSGSVLCWNGEAWRIASTTITADDALAVFNVLLQAAAQDSASSDAKACRHVASVIASVVGPFALVFYDAQNGLVYYGRDCLGRRSLLCKSGAAHGLTLASTGCADGDYHEVEADGIYMVDLQQISQRQPTSTCFRWVAGDSKDVAADRLALPFPAMNISIPTGQVPLLALGSASVHKLCRLLETSVQTRISNIYRPASSGASDPEERSTLGILFSGGLDCTVIARLAHDNFPRDQAIDLINVAFENPRIHTAGAGDQAKSVSPYALCPDRITGRSSLAALQQSCPGRIWRFVEIDVPYAETVEHRANVMELMHPHNTEMDLSIALALYFAARGRGVVHESAKGTSTEYITPATVLLSGLGADELFGGYQRHAIAFTRHGFAGLVTELELDVNRLGKRNLGRDDRVISHWGREARFPYLDEDLLSWALAVPVWEKCGFGEQELSASEEAPAIEPGKKVLRLLAHELGLTGVAIERKRAIQFGARTAKMHSGKIKGTQAIS